MMVKKYTYYIEKWCSIVLSLFIVMILNFFCLVEKLIVSKAIFDKTVDFSGITFGFLLTIFAILVQSDNATIKRIKEADRWKDILSLNMLLISISAFLCLYSLSLITIIELNLAIISKLNFCKILTSTYLFLLFWLIIQSIIFLNIFYNLFKKYQ